MEGIVNPDVSLLDEVRMQAQVLVPVLRALRAELGKEHADRLVTTALRGWSRDLYGRIAAGLPGTGKEKWSTMTAAVAPRLVGGIDMEVLRVEPDAMEFNITGCRYADFFRQLGEPELGAVLLCEADEHVVAAVGSDVALTRKQTIMQGAAYCDFRYRMKE
jgi:hypothetical protein